MSDKQTLTHSQKLKAVMDNIGNIECKESFLDDEFYTKENVFYLAGIASIILLLTLSILAFLII